MPISMDLHVKCPFYKMWNEKKSTIFYPVKFSHGIWGANSYILPNFQVRGGKTLDCLSEIKFLQQYMFLLAALMYSSIYARFNTKLTNSWPTVHIPVRLHLFWRVHAVTQLCDQRITSRNVHCGILIHHLVWKPERSTNTQKLLEQKLIFTEARMVEITCQTNCLFLHTTLIRQSKCVCTLGWSINRVQVFIFSKSAMVKRIHRASEGYKRWLWGPKTSLKMDMPILTCIFFTFNWLTLTSEMYFKKLFSGIAINFKFFLIFPKLQRI